MVDIALIEDDAQAGKLMAHRPDCPMVSEHRALGRMICTMGGVDKPLPPDLKRHECLLEPSPNSLASPRTRKRG